MQRKRGGLVPIDEVVSDLDVPVPAIRGASPQARHHFTQADQVDQLVSASEADPDLGFMARMMVLCRLPPLGRFPSLTATHGLRQDINDLRGEVGELREPTKPFRRVQMFNMKRPILTATVVALLALIGACGGDSARSNQEAIAELLPVSARPQEQRQGELWI